MAIQDQKSVLKSFVSTIPASLIGLNRVTYLFENIDKLRPEDKIGIRNLFNKLLTSMIERDASDIELGGHGNSGYIWLRIYGKKARVKDFPLFTEDESALIILTFTKCQSIKSFINYS